jgi:group I intron endonuclease
MEKHYIYKLTSPSGKVYIGRTNNFKQRMLSHESSANRGEKRPIYDSIKKYGWDNFKKEVIATVNGKQLAAQTELHYIQLFDSINSGYNLSLDTEGGGDNWEGRKETQEYETFVDKMKVLNNQPIRMHGKHHTDEAKAKQKAAAVGRYSLPWFIAKHGQDKGTELYEQRRQWLKNRNLKKNDLGRFIAS